MLAVNGKLVARSILRLSALVYGLGVAQLGHTSTKRAPRTDCPRLHPLPRAGGGVVEGPASARSRRPGAPARRLKDPGAPRATSLCRVPMPRRRQWSGPGSNRQPLACKASALPIELPPLNAGVGSLAWVRDDSVRGSRSSPRPDSERSWHSRANRRATLA
jgi:hypothetical protein